MYSAVYYKEVRGANRGTHTLQPWLRPAEGSTQPPTLGRARFNRRRSGSEARDQKVYVWLNLRAVSRASSSSYCTNGSRTSSASPSGLAT